MRDRKHSQCCSTNAAEDCLHICGWNKLSGGNRKRQHHSTRSSIVSGFSLWKATPVFFQIFCFTQSKFALPLFSLLPYNLSTRWFLFLHYVRSIILHFHKPEITNQYLQHFSPFFCGLLNCSLLFTISKPMGDLHFCFKKYLSFLLKGPQNPFSSVVYFC